jgi:outer membrane receptor protein involved in Fe transport
MATFCIMIMLFNTSGGKIQGTVTNENTGEPIPYANVMIRNTELGAATDQDGNFFILNVPRGRYRVEISCLGYQTQIVDYVIVEFDQTARLRVRLKQTAIEIPPVTVTSELPSVTKDMVGTTYIVRRSELAILPVDYAVSAIAFQPSVARSDTAFHVRGGRATEVLYLVDNVSVLDPQTGDPTVYVSKGSVNEVIFLPGGFDAEYGRAMSGVINLLTAHPANNIQGNLYSKTETIMPFYYDFGYQNYQSSIHLPISRKAKGFLSFDVMHTDDWNPKLFILPHKQRDDYSLYGKWYFSPSGKLQMTLSGVKARSQFDRYDTRYKYILDDYRSDMRDSDLEVFNASYMPNSKSLFKMTLSRLHTKRIYGVREEGPYGLLDNFRFRDYQNLHWPETSTPNPFGVWAGSFLTGVSAPYFSGNYPQYQEKSSHIIKGNFSTNLQAHRYHEIKAGFEYAYQDFENFTYYVSDTAAPITDVYQHKPREYTLYLQDNIDYKGLYAKVGCRYDYFDADIEDVEPKVMISPRFGFSFLVTDKFLFRANVSRFAQPPLYDYMYSLYNLLPLPSHIATAEFLPPVGNPDLKPEKTTSYEIGFQGEIRENLVGTLNMFYKDVSDLIGTRFVNAMPVDYWQYDNVEYANIKGIEAIVEFMNTVFRGKVSYTLSWARGTSSYAAESYFWWIRQTGGDTTVVPPKTEYYLDFDQRHKIFVQGTARLPLETDLHLFAFIGQGFPYTPPGPEGKYEERNINLLPNQFQVDCVISKPIRFGRFSINAIIEIINLLDVRNEITYHEPLLDWDDIHPSTVDYYIYAMPVTEDIGTIEYNPAADINHDGMISPREVFVLYRDFLYATDDWVNAYSEPRRARVGISMSF